VLLLSGVDAGTEISPIGVDVHMSSGYIGDACPPPSSVVACQVEGLGVDVLGGMDVTARTVEGSKVLEFELSPVDELLEAAGVVAPHGSTDVAAGDGS